jgi:8-oxo-dGTP diphosphatase
MAESHHPRVGVGVLLVDESGRVLLTLREHPPEVGHWSIVGGISIAIDSLLCVTDHCLPAEGQHWVSPAYLARILSGEAKNREPHKTREVRWFPPDNLPPNLTMTAKNAIAAYKAPWSAAPRPEAAEGLGAAFDRAASHPK